MTGFMRVLDFEELNISDAYVLIKYKGRIHTTYYDGERFLFTKNGNECYLTECVTGVSVLETNSLSPWQPCPRCAGLTYHGRPGFERECTYCAGTGQVYKGEPQHA